MGLSLRGEGDQAEGVDPQEEEVVEEEVGEYHQAEGVGEVGEAWTREPKAVRGHQELQGVEMALPEWQRRWLSERKEMAPSQKQSIQSIFTAWLSSQASR